MTEAESVFGESRDVGCVVSIGTGRPKVNGFKKSLFWQRFLPLDLIDALKKSITSSESIAEEMAANYRHFEKLHHRLNAEQGMEHIGLEEWKTLAEVRTHTKAYLSQRDVDQKIDEIVGALVGRQSPKYTLRQIGR